MSNGIVTIDGRTYIMCGSKLVEIRYLDRQGRPVANEAYREQNRKVP